MQKKVSQTIIIIPGLNDDIRLVKFITRNWQQKYKIEINFYEMKWLDNSESFSEKLQGLSRLIDRIYNSGRKVIILGISAGGSAAINVASKKQSRIYKIVNVCGRLSEGVDIYPKLEIAGKKSFAFINSVKIAEENLKISKVNFRKKILTIRPKFGDFIVPPSLVVIKGANNLEIPTFGHVFSILIILLFPKKIIDFIKK